MKYKNVVFAIGKFKSKLLRSFSCQTGFVFVAWIEAQYVMVSFDFIASLIFVIVGIELCAFLIKRERMAV